MDLALPADVLGVIERGGDLVVSLSGGKDSTATYLHLLERGVLEAVERAGGVVRRVFADTGWELDETYAYLDELEFRFGKIDRVALWVPGPGEQQPNGYDLMVPIWVTERGGDGGVMHADRFAFARLLEARLGRYSPMIRLMMQWRKVPTAVRRWCTDDLKKRPIVEYLAGCADPLNVIGVRAEESRKRAAMPEVEWSDTYDATIWRPIHALLKSEVIDLHTRHGIAPNPVYLQGQGAGRVGCGPCVYSGANDIRWLTAEKPERLALLAEVERCLALLNPPRAQKGAGNPHWFHVSRQGQAIAIAVGEAVQLASHDLGGSAPLLFEERQAPGCAEWGLCVW